MALHRTASTTCCFVRAWRKTDPREVPTKNVKVFSTFLFVETLSFTSQNGSCYCWLQLLVTERAEITDHILTVKHKLPPPRQNQENYHTGKRVSVFQNACCGRLFFKVSVHFFSSTSNPPVFFRLILQIQELAEVWKENEKTFLLQEEIMLLFHNEGSVSEHQTQI